MVLTELLRYYRKDFVTKHDGCQWKEKGKIPDLSRRRVGVMKRDKIRYFYSLGEAYPSRLHL